MRNLLEFINVLFNTDLLNWFTRISFAVDITHANVNRQIEGIRGRNTDSKKRLKFSENFPIKFQFIQILSIVIELFHEVPSPLKPTEKRDQNRLKPEAKFNWIFRTTWSMHKTHFTEAIHSSIHLWIFLCQTQFISSKFDPMGIALQNSLSFFYGSQKKLHNFTILNGTPKNLVAYLERFLIKFIKHISADWGFPNWNIKHDDANVYDGIFTIK